MTSEVLVDAIFGDYLTDVNVMEFVLKKAYDNFHLWEERESIILYDKHVTCCRRIWY